jgi:hypothetical protein
MNKMWGFIYNMGDIGELNQILSRRDCQIIPLSYTSQFGFVFNMIYSGKTEILKTYILVDSDNSSEGREFELPNYIDVKLDNKIKTHEVIINAYDDLPGHVKRMETISNFTREAQIQNDVYNASINNGSLCPEIYGSYILYHEIATAFLESLKTKCQQQSEEGINMIQYLQNNLGRYDLGIIRMEYAEGYITFREAERNQTLYENVIYANIRLLMETGYMHLDLNPGNVMVRGDDVLLIDFGKSKSITDIKKKDFTNISKIIEKEILEPKDIQSMISFINRFDAIENDSSLFQQNFVSNLSNPEASYQNIANKLNERENKTISPKYGELLQILQNTAVSSNSSQTNHVFGFIGSQSHPSTKRSSLFGSESPPSTKRSSLFGSESPPLNKRSSLFGSESPPSTKRSSLFGSESPPSNKSPPKRRGDSLFRYESPPKRTEIFRDPDSENSDPNIFSFYTNLPRTPGGAKKSKKKKRKLLHNKRISKTRKNKSNKKRVKLISKK